MSGILYVVGTPIGINGMMSPTRPQRLLRNATL